MQRGKRCLALIAAATLAVGGLCGCKARGGDSFGFSLSAEPAHLDPQAANDAASLAVLDATFEGLTRVQADGTVTAGAADWTVSEDGLTYTFTLKTSYWSTVSVRGEQTGFEEPVMVTAQDFLFGIRRTADPTTNSPHAKWLLNIQNAPAVLAGEMPLSALGVKAVDEQTLVITLSEADSGFLKTLATPAFMPCNREFFAYTGGRYGLEKRYTLSNGAFYVSGWDHGVSVTLRKNEHYHDAENVLPASVKYAVSKSQEEDYGLLEKGALDAAAVPTSLLEDAAKAGISLVGLQDAVQCLWFNTATPTLQNTAIRKALAFAVEWDALRGSLPTGYTPASGFVPPAATANGKPYTQAQNVTLFKTDTAAAKTQLQEGMTALGLETPPTFKLLAADDTENANLARYIVQSLSKNLGISCTLELVSVDTLAARVQAGNYEMAVHTVVGNGATAKENLEIFISTAPRGNFARFADTAYDTLYAGAGEDIDAVQRLEAYLADTVPCLPLGFYTRYYGVSPDARGITVRPFNGGAFGAPLSFTAAELR